jgi:hypothetical protein
MNALRAVVSLVLGLAVAGTFSQSAKHQVDDADTRSARRAPTGGDPDARQRPRSWLSWMWIALTDRRSWTFRISHP